MLRLDLINQLIDHYQVLEKLGEGGMAVIYKAVDTRNGEVVAIKFLRPFLSDSTRALKRFEREARTLSRLSHPSIVRVLGFGEHEGCPYLVMEYMPGGTLKPKIGKPLHWQTSAQFLLPVARALAYAHTNGTIHRDIKPANILLTENGEPKLADFGIAKLTDGDETTLDLTGTGLGIGTPDYMAPEQFTGSADPRVDIYALGVVFYELVTGAKPFTSTTAGGVILKKTSEQTPLPTRLVRDLPVEVESFLLRLLNKDPQARCQSMVEVVSILDKLAAGQLVIPLPQKQPLPRLRWEIVALGGIVLVAGITLLAVLTWLLASGRLAAKGKPAPTPTASANTIATGLPGSAPGAATPVPSFVTVVPFLFQDEFTDPAGGWDRGSNQDFLTDYQDGGYRIRINSSEKVAWSTPGLHFNNDVRLEVYATKQGGPNNNAFGVLCRHSRAGGKYSFYFFYISSGGSAAIGKYVDGELSYLANSASAIPAINQGAATNRINADCLGENLVLYANGTQILAAADSSLQAGDVGLIARTFREAGTDIVFDDFTVAKP